MLFSGEMLSSSSDWRFKDNRYEDMGILETRLYAKREAKGLYFSRINIRIHETRSS
jgi:hypothetical protein